MLRRKWPSLAAILLHLVPVDGPPSSSAALIAVLDGEIDLQAVRSPGRLLARGVDGGLGAAARRGDSPGPADGSHLPAPSSSAEEPIAAIGLEPRHAHSRRHLELLQDLSCSRIDAPQIALVTFPGAVPELAVDPGDPGDEAAGLDGAKNSSCLWIDLKDLPVAILPDPERPFGPCEPRATAARRRDRGEHTAGVRIDLLDAILGELKQMLAVEGRSCMRGNIDRAQYRPARGIERVDFVSGCKPDVPTVERNATYAVDARKGSILANDFRR